MPNTISPPKQKSMKQAMEAPAPKNMPTGMYEALANAMRQQQPYVNANQGNGIFDEQGRTSYIPRPVANREFDAQRQMLESMYGVPQRPTTVYEQMPPIERIVPPYMTPAVINNYPAPQDIYGNGGYGVFDEQGRTSYIPRQIADRVDEDARRQMLESIYSSLRRR